MDGRRTKLRFLVINPQIFTWQRHRFIRQTCHVHGVSCLVCVCLWWVGWFFACLAGVPCSWLVGFLWVRMTLYSWFFMTFGIHSVFGLIGDVDSDYFPGKLTFFTWKWGAPWKWRCFSFLKPPFSGSSRGFISGLGVLSPGWNPCKPQATGSCVLKSLHETSPA